MRALFSSAKDARDAPRRRGAATALAAMAEDGMLGGYPGPALLIDADGTVLARNDAAALLAQALQDSPQGGLRQRVLDVLGDGTPQVDSFELNGDGGPLWIEAAILPQGKAVALLLGRDVTLDRRLRAVLVESRQRYRDLVEASSDFAWETGADATLTFVSPQGALGHSAVALVGRDPASVLLCGDDEASESLPFATRRPIERVEFWCRRSDGTAACLVAAAVPLLNEAGDWRGARGVCREVTAERERDSVLARYRRQERTLAYITKVVRDDMVPQEMLDAAAGATARAVGTAGCSIFRRAPEGKFALVAQHGKAPSSHAILGLLKGAIERQRVGCFEGDLKGHRLLACHTDYRQRVNGAICLWNPAVEGKWSEESRSMLLAVADQLGIALEHVSQRENLERLSLTDSLTGLANRRAFDSALGAALSRAERTGRPGALMYLDLDNFKLVNDAHGHERGDIVLRAVADIIKSKSRPYDHAARLGGDEFALWFEEIGEAAVRKRAAEILEAATELASESPDPSRPLSLSIGIALYEPGLGEHVGQLVGRADAAMYQAKYGGKGRFAVASLAAARQAAAATGE